MALFFSPYVLASRLLSTSTPRANCKNCHPAIPRWKVLIVLTGVISWGHQPKLHRFFLVENPIQNDAKARFFCIKVGSHHKNGGNWMTPVLIIGCLWFSYWSCLSHKAPHIEEEKNDICHQILRIENTKDDGTKYHKIDKRNQLRIWKVYLRTTLTLVGDSRITSAESKWNIIFCNPLL